MIGPVHRASDAAARQRIETDLQSTLFVEAAAGTGKTTSLVARIMACLVQGVATLESIVAVTFTEKAAGEMKLRLREEIERGRAALPPESEGRLRLEKALEHLEAAHVGTIHAFCADLLHERPVAARVDPLFEVAAEDVSGRLLDQAFDDWFESCLNDPPEGVRRLLRRRPELAGDPTPRQLLRQAALTLSEQRDFDAPWQHFAFDRAGAIDAIVDAMAAYGAEAGRSSRRGDSLAANAAEAARFVEDVLLREGVRARDYDGLEAAFRSVVKWKSWDRDGSGSHYGPGVLRRDVLARRDELRARIRGFLVDANANLAPLLAEELRPVIAAYEERKAREGRLDFLDLLAKTRDLLVADATVRAELQSRYSHYFVDEFQDTDPLQVDILFLLAADDPAVAQPAATRPVAGKLFLVGDPKQSIYRFRRADVAVYERAKAHLVAAGAEVLHLTDSFRGTPSLQMAVNGAFAPRMTGTDHQAAYVPLKPVRSESTTQPSLVALPVPAPYSEYGNVTNSAIRASLPDAVGAFTEWLLSDSGWSVTERGPDGQVPVPIQARHICLLMRRLNSAYEEVTGPYVQALESRGIPHVLVGGRGFHDRDEVAALRSAIHAIEWPDDLLAVYATLRGPLFALTDDQLFAYRQATHNLHPLAPPPDAELEPPLAEVADALGVLRRLHSGRNRRPIAATLTTLLDEVRAHAGVAVWSAGEQALANLLRVVDRARRFESQGALSFRAFADRLDEEAAAGVAEEAPVVEEGTEGVRIMTVYKAKGLEFPVVILADPTFAGPANPQQFMDPARRLWVKNLCGCTPREVLDNAADELAREAAEAVRVAYVAATRARDILIVPAVADAERRGWSEALNPALYPPAETRGSPEEAPGCPAFGEDTVAVPPMNRRGSVLRPGLHTAKAGNPVVWWDPTILDLNRDHASGLREVSLLQAAEDEAADTAAQDHATWQSARAERLSLGRRPSRRTVRATDRAAAVVAEAASADTDGAVAILSAGTAEGRTEGGLRFGSLVHGILEVVDLQAGGQSIESLAAALGRQLGATPAETAAASQAVTAALALPILSQAGALAPDRVLREVPIVHRLADGELIEGVIDLAYRTEHEWIVIDFKTFGDANPPVKAAWTAQVSLYCAALSAATSAPARGAILVL